MLEPGAASVPGVCSGIELRVQVPLSRIDKGRVRREGPFSFGVFVCARVSGAPSLSSKLLSAFAVYTCISYIRFNSALACFPRSPIIIVNKYRDC